jgi:hypothetical protein
MGSEPYWFLALAAVCAIVVLYMVPEEISARLHAFFIESPAARNVTALAALVGFGVVLFTALQIKLDLDDRAAEREIRRDEAIERAWARLLTRAGGNVGKGGALTTLHREGVFLNAIDLSCRALGDWDFATERCVRRVIFGDIELAGAFDQGKLTAATLDFTDAYIENPSVSNALVLHLGLDRAVVSSPSVRDSIVSITAGESSWMDGTLAGSTLTALPGARIRLQRMDVSGSTLEGLASGAIGAHAGDLYYWADSPPLDSLLNGATVAIGAPNPVLRAELRRTLQACMPPRRDGQAIPLPRAERPRLGVYSCEKVSLEDAEAAFPAVYAARP